MIDSANSRKDSFKLQLPKYVSRWKRAIVAISFLGNACSIAALYFVFSPPDVDSIRIPEGVNEVIFASTLSVISLSLLFYTLIRSTQKKHKYAEVLPHIHFVNHICRDYIYNPTVEFETVISECVHAIAEAFAIVTGRRCSVSLKKFYMSETGEARVGVYCDYGILKTSLSNLIDESNPSAQKDFRADEFSSVDAIMSKHNRYYLANNLPKLWRNHEYKNPYLQLLRKPKYFMGFVWGWKLPMKSTLVVPIRYYNESNEGASAIDYWGFLCVDCHGTNVLNHHFAPELAASFADTLFNILKIK